MLGYWSVFRYRRVPGYWSVFRYRRVPGYWPVFRYRRVPGYWSVFRYRRVPGCWPVFRYRRVPGCAGVGLAGRDRRAFAGPVIAKPRETLVRPAIAERQETVVFVQVIWVDQASSPIGFYLGHRRRQRRLLIPVIPGTGRRGHASSYVHACFRRGPREGAQLGLGLRQRLPRQVSSVRTAPRLAPGLRSALSRVRELVLTGVLALRRVPGLALTGLLALTGVPGLALTGLLALTGVLGLVLTGVPGLAGLRLWPRGPRAGHAATRRCARTLALPSRPVLSHDPAYPPDDSLSAFT